VELTQPLPPAVQWLAPADNPWPVPVLDVRPITLTMLATSTDPLMASNSVSYGNDDGSAFADQLPPADRTIPCELSYKIDRYFAEGVLFIPATMDHKWALYHYNEKLIVVRSWLRRVVVTASVRVVPGFVQVTRIDGAFLDPVEVPDLTVATLDFIIRSHALSQPWPAPLAEPPGKDLERAALWCFSMHGNRAEFATASRFAAEAPDRPLRTHSRFHIAIARGDLATAQSQLDVGVPIDLLAGDGLSALQWALGAPGVEIMQWLLDRGLAVDVRSAEGATALMNATQSNDLERAAWLLAKGADANAADDRGFTSLHRAAEMGHVNCARLLLNHGARRDASAFGHTALSFAQQRGHSALVALLTANN
jgi:hypothetical protein